ncbi:hypothetical protein EZS27_008347 [termite gut metagenome]|uniref:Uncharacterized protein n=1 Tax=termite gut metagenome TaxID=433724 RepID=A0A5J4SCV3_9ZZZZ
MRKKDIKAVFFGGIVLFSLLSCIDSKYDLGKDIDLTMLVGGEKLALPVGSSEKMYLNKFVKVENTELLDTLETGEYYLAKEDTMSDTKVTVKDVEINDQQFKIDEIVFHVAPPSIGKVGEVKLSVNVGEEIEDGSFEFRNNSMPLEIKRMQSFYIRREEDQRYYINISFTADNLQGDDQIDLTDLQITFPDFFIFEKDQKGFDNETNTYTVGNRTAKEVIYLDSNNDAKHEIPLYLDHFEFQHEDQGWVDQKKNDAGEVIESTFFIKDKVIMEGEIEAILQDLSAYESGNDKITLTTDVNLKPESFFVASMVGKVDPKIDMETVKVELTGIPDFLDDDDVRMDLTNPSVSFHVENPFGLPILLNLDMQGWKNEKKTHDESIKVNEIVIPANLDPDPDQPPTSAIIILSKLGSITPDPNHYKVSELSDLFYVIPDEIELKIEAKVDTTKVHTIFLGETGKVVKINYGVNLPLSFGENMSIVYKDTINGWNEDVKDLDIKRINLETEILNTIPLELSLSGYAIDVNGKKLERMIVDIKDNAVIPPCKEDGSESIVSIVIEIVELVPALSDTPTSIMKDLDGIVLNITAKSTETINNKPLKSTQYMMLKGMKARIPGGVNLNMND